MKRENNKTLLLYRKYLLACLNQDIDEKIDNSPLNYELFVKNLKKTKNYDIMKKKV